MSPRRALLWLTLGFAAFVAGLVLAPGPIEPVSWEAPEDEGLTGAFAENDALAGAEATPIGGYSGPEDAAVAPDGALLVAAHEGVVLRIAPDGSVAPLFETGGRPLGLAVGPDGAVYVADAYRGLLSWRADTGLETLVAEIDGAPLRYANAVALASDGSVYFTQSTRRFDPAALGATLEASVLDIAEHRETGRLLVWRPESGRVETVAAGFSFANGVALSADERYAVVVETGSYRLWRVALAGAGRGERTALIDNLPGFPDNVSRDPAGELYWVGIGSLRRPIADALADWPALRAIVFKLPDALRPGPLRHGIVFAVDGAGVVRATLQDPSGALGLVSGARRVGDALVVTMLEGGALYRTPAPASARLTDH